MSKLLLSFKFTSAFSFLINKALSPDRNRKLGHLDVAFIVSVLTSILLAVGATYVKNENDRTISSPIITGRILSVTFVNQARAYHRRASIEFAKPGSAFDVCTAQADFDIGSKEIAAGNEIRIYQPNPPCDAPLFPDYMTPVWELPLFSAMCMLVSLFLFFCTDLETNIVVLTHTSKIER